MSNSNYQKGMHADTEELALFQVRFNQAIDHLQVSFESLQSLYQVVEENGWEDNNQQQFQSILQELRYAQLQGIQERAEVLNARLDRAREWIGEYLGNHTAELTMESNYEGEADLGGIIGLIGSGIDAVKSWFNPGTKNVNAEEETLRSERSPYRETIEGQIQIMNACGDHALELLGMPQSVDKKKLAEVAVYVSAADLDQLRQLCKAGAAERCIVKTNKVYEGCKVCKEMYAAHSFKAEHRKKGFYSYRPDDPHFRDTVFINREKKTVKQKDGSSFVNYRTAVHEYIHYLSADDDHGVGFKHKRLISDYKDAKKELKSNPLITPEMRNTMNKKVERYHYATVLNEGFTELYARSVMEDLGLAYQTGSYDFFVDYAKQLELLIGREKTLRAYKTHDIAIIDNTINQMWKERQGTDEPISNTLSALLAEYNQLYGMGNSSNERKEIHQKVAKIIRKLRSVQLRN